MFGVLLSWCHVTQTFQKIRLIKHQLDFQSYNSCKNVTLKKVAQHFTPWQT